MSFCNVFHLKLGCVIILLSLNTSWTGVEPDKEYAPAGEANAFHTFSFLVSRPLLRSPQGVTQRFFRCRDIEKNGGKGYYLFKVVKSSI